MRQPEFLPTTRGEMNALGWDELDILLVSGDAYVDSHSFAAALLGRWLLAHGFKTGIVAQPGWEDPGDVLRMGRPRLFAGVSAGALDSLLAHYTAFRKKRGEDAYSPGGRTGLRPNRAAIVYAGLLRRAFPGLPVALGGIEASLRRASHYDFWSNSLRRSILLDAKADVVLYGMGEKGILRLAELFSAASARQRPGESLAKARLPGSVHAVHPDSAPRDAEELPSHEAILAEPRLLIQSSLAFERQMLQGKPCFVQRAGGRAVVMEAPSEPLSTEEMDMLYGLPFTRRAHPSYAEPIPAVAMLEGSVTSHRGCGGGCSFCSLSGHQGRVVQSRSAESILSEIGARAKEPGWKGSLSDIGGPSANMWLARCEGAPDACKRESCLYPKRCRNFRADQEKQAELLRRAAGIRGVEHVRVASGVRHDLALESEEYLKALIGEFTGGQLKIAPEHVSEKILRLMRKPPVRLWETFLKRFQRLSGEAGKEQYVVPYLLSAFPGSTEQDTGELAAWLRRRGWRPQQIQCFIPTPGTVATAMFHAGEDTEGRPIPVARSDAERLRLHRILVPDAERPPEGSVAPERGKKPFGARSGAPQRAVRNGDVRGRTRRGGDTRRSGPGGRQSDGKPGGRKPFGDKPPGSKPFGGKKPGRPPFSGKPPGGRGRSGDGRRRGGPRP